MSRFRRVDKSKGGGTGNRGNYSKNQKDQTDFQRKKSYLAAQERYRQLENEEDDKIDEEFGFARHVEGTRTGFCFNLRTTSIADDTGTDFSALDLYFVEEDGSTFKATFIHSPYFLVAISGDGTQVQELESYLARRFDGLVHEVDTVRLNDLDQVNHLSTPLRLFVRIKFRNVQDLMAVRRVLLPAIKKNIAEQELLDTYGDYKDKDDDRRKIHDIMNCIIDIREYDLPYSQRVCIDCGVRVGLWYDVKGVQGSKGCELEERKDIEQRPLMRTLAFDIETTKLPLKFPDAEFDKVMMISYMLDNQGYLIVNREIVSEDIEDFEYTPKQEYPGPFRIFNEKDELATLQRFFRHIKEVRPLLYVTFNGDFFDWPFIEKRANKYNMSLRKTIGVWLDEKAAEYMGRFCVHLDCFAWVKRDSYLPQGSQGLKAVTKAKLGYNPLELDPEDMLPFASEQPQVLASYSVSDAVATYYLYKKYIHLFIFSLSTIIPMPPSDVLRKGSGTLCEVLLMVKAADKKIVCPNKQQQEFTKFHKGHLLESETYIGGHVEALESGIFRSDLNYKFRLNPARLQWLLDKLDSTLKFGIVDEAGLKMEDVVNYDEVREAIASQLIKLRDQPNIEILPMIYHLDVGAMYPNIILTNRLQPMATVDQATCASCDFNRPGKNCQRTMQWNWRGKYYPATRSEYEAIKNQLESEPLSEKDKQDSDPWGRGKQAKQFSDLKEEDRAKKVEARVKSYSHKVYKKITTELVEQKDAVICQRENPFYVNTVRAFRDRRYVYKGLTKKWASELSDATAALDIIKCKDMVLLYDSMQLAHKCILNSFYGYVMRTGARWRSIEMAGVVTYTGADIIRDARELVEDIGRPLELDTDGIWCILPASFPENYIVKTKQSEAGKGRPLTLSYACIVLNHGVNERYTNNQYQNLVDPKKKKYETDPQCTIYFEVDGPYRAMVLPASKDEGKTIKKRYAVFNPDGSLAELKGFEIKRRGELKLIKIFQGGVFKSFLNGKTLEECYSVVGEVANHWLNILYSKGADLEDEDVFELIGENKNMSKPFSHYAGTRSTAVTTAKRLAEFLGNDVIEGKGGLSCRFIVANKPGGTSVSDRAIPVAIFKAEDATKKFFLRKWLKDSSMDEFDIRDILDWDYYIGRLASAIQKIITIPAAFQKVKNPVPRVKHPDWLHKRLRDRNDTAKQSKLASFFSRVDEDGNDIEDLASVASQKSTFQDPLRRTFARVKKRKPIRSLNIQDEEEDEEEEGEGGGGGKIEIEDDQQEDDTKEVMDITGEDLAEQMADDLLSEEDDDEEQPDPSDTQAFLRYQKKHWKLLRKAKRRKRAVQPGQQTEATGTEDPSTGIAGGMQNYLRQSARRVATNFWQIVQVVPDNVPGQFRVWVCLDDGALRSVLVVVPRVIYLNTRSPNEIGQANGRKVERKLPRGRPCMHLYEMEMTEGDFLANSKDMNTLLNHPEVEGVYEMRVPLMFKLIMEVGNMVKVENASQEEKDSGVYKLSSLQYKTASDFEGTYLSHMRARKIFLYHSAFESRGVYGLFLEASNEALIVVMTTATGAVERVNFKKVLLDAMQTEDETDIPNSLTFNVRQVGSKTAALRIIRERLQEEQTGATSQSLVLSQWREGLDNLFATLPVLQDGFPTIEVPASARDDEYPTLQWFPFAAQRMIQRYVMTPKWLSEHLEMCSYAMAPIGNLKQDSIGFVGDLIFARSLKNSNHLLWMSPTPEPDLGGLQEDENFFESEYSNPEVINPTCSRKICVEVELGHLAVNTVLKSQLIEEMEGGMGLSAPVSNEEDTADTDKYMQGTYATRDAFKIMKNVVTNWVTDTVKDKNRQADALIRHFYRWLRSPTSMLYDPALHTMVHKMMIKVFMQLMQRFRKLGSSIVYGSFNKLIICTGKPTVERGMAYCKYLLDTIREKPLFEWLDLLPSTMWETLLFYDCANFGGIKTIERAEEEGEADDDTGNWEMESNWNISDYLPTMAKEYFEVVTGEFCLLPYKHIKALETEHPSQDLSQSTNFQTPEEKATEFKKYMVDLVSTYLSRRLFKIVKDIGLRHSGNVAAGDTESASDFPILAGSHLALHSPALEFVKFVCSVLALDKTLENEVLNLKNNLMKMLDVRSFSKKAEFHNPCLTFVLPDTICSYCNNRQDLDLCRDPHIAHKNWDCQECGQPYDRGLIESELVRIVSRRSVSYQVQDLMCKACGKVKREDMSTHCPCSNVFLHDVKPADFQKSLKCFKNIAQFHGFEWLNETVDWMMSH